MSFLNTPEYFNHYEYSTPDPYIDSVTASGTETISHHDSNSTPNPHHGSSQASAKAESALRTHATPVPLDSFIFPDFSTEAEFHKYFQLSNHTLQTLSLRKRREGNLQCSQWLPVDDWGVTLAAVYISFWLHMRMHMCCDVWRDESTGRVRCEMDYEPCEEICYYILDEMYDEMWDEIWDEMWDERLDEISDLECLEMRNAMWDDICGKVYGM
ncbi:hypothetical protein FPQ18DRAFT_342109, partial [Pyronema domesticum]